MTSVYAGWSSQAEGLAYNFVIIRKEGAYERCFHIIIFQTRKLHMKTSAISIHIVLSIYDKTEWIITNLKLWFCVSNHHEIKDVKTLLASGLCGKSRENLIY